MIRKVDVEKDAADIAEINKWYEENITAVFDTIALSHLEMKLSMKKKGITIDNRMRSGVHGWYYWITGMALVLHYTSIGLGKS